MKYWRGAKRYSAALPPPSALQPKYGGGSPPPDPPLPTPMIGQGRWSKFKANGGETCSEIEVAGWFHQCT